MTFLLSWGSYFYFFTCDAFLALDFFFDFLFLIFFKFFVFGAFLALDFLLVEAVEFGALVRWVGEPKGCPVDVLEGEPEGRPVGVFEGIAVEVVEGVALGR